MPTRRNNPNWPVLVLAGLVMLVVALALVATGGPGQGRKERRDEARLQDLARLSAHAEGLAREAGGALPAELATSAECPGELRLADPYGGDAYRYEALSGESYRLCAPFETPLDERMPWNAANVDAAA